MKTLSTFLLLFCFNFITWACPKEFPICINLKGVPKDAQVLHQELAAMVYVDKDETSKNYFACAFIIYTKGKNITIHITVDIAKVQGIPIDKLAKEVKSCCVFESGDSEDIVFNYVESLEVDFNTIIESSKYVPAAYTILASAKAITDRSRSYSEVKYANRITDSEIRALSVLGRAKVIANIVKEIKKQNIQDITRIEFHGCTTRDMCGLCFIRMNMWQELSNENHKDSFICKLKQALEFQKITFQENLFLTTYISSLTSAKDEHNLNFRINDLQVTPKKQHVHQMRITTETHYPDKKEIYLQRKSTKSKKSSSKKTIQKRSSKTSFKNSYLNYQEREYVLVDVPRDGNCGVFAYLFASGQINVDFWEGGEVEIPTCCEGSKEYTIAERFRQDIVKGEQNAKLISRLGSMATAKENLEHWLWTTDFRFIAQKKKRDIIIYSKNPGQAPYTLYTKDGAEELALDINDFSVEEPVIIYYEGNHYKAYVLTK